jgi:hypothetical protein
MVWFFHTGGFREGLSSGIMSGFGMRIRPWRHVASFAKGREDGRGLYDVQFDQLKRVIVFTQDSLIMPIPIDEIIRIDDMIRQIEQKIGKEA